MSKITQQQQKYELSHEEANAIKLNKSQNISDIQWFMIDKKKYFPMTVLNMFAVRTVLYPLTLVRTRLQIQPVNKKIYTGTIHALYSVVKYEGYLALYKGFLINNLALIPHVLYITTYERVRHQVSKFTKNLYIMSFVGGACGSIFAQMLTVPIDVISQHMMLAGQKSNSTTTIKNPQIKEIDRIHVPQHLKSASGFRVAQFISKEIYKNENIRGFYRGYFLSTFLVSLNSALWWPFYYFYQSKIRPNMPDSVPTIIVQCLCGPLSSFSANFLTNPLDVMRTNMQISKQRQSSITVLNELWKQDGWRLFYRGLTARLSYSCFYSFLIILGYESVKKASLKEEYQAIYYSID